MESDNTKEEPDVNHRKTKAGPEEKTEVKNKSAEMENKYGKTAAVGDKLKAVPIAKGLAEVPKSKTVPIAKGSSTAESKQDPRNWWDWWAGVDWTGGTGGEIAKTEAEGNYNNSMLLNVDTFAKKVS